MIKYYKFKIFDKAFENGFFSKRELKALEDIAQNWDFRKFDQDQKKILERFVVLVGYDVLVEGYNPLSEYFSKNTFNANAVKQLTFRIIDDLPEFGNDLSMSFHERYE